MKALIYSPYWDTLGGGERFTASVAEALVQNGYGVTLAWNDGGLLEKLKQRFNMAMTEVNVDETSYEILALGNRWKKYSFMKDFDVVFWVSDGSVPFLFGKKNIVLFQIPFSRVKSSLLTQGIKQHFIHQSICYSDYVKSIIDPLYGITSKVMYPPVIPFQSHKKERLILSVGRFDNLLHSKRQDVLIDAFKSGHFDGWKLILAGGSLHGTEHLKSLHDAIGSDPTIELVVNPTYSQLADLYGSATLYWHAAGYGQDLHTHPELAEHFGITTVEAMSAKAVPLVFAAGGQTEIVSDGENGFLWNTVEELVQKSSRVIDDHLLQEKVSLAAQHRSKDFSPEEFGHAFKSLIS